MDMNNTIPSDWAAASANSVSGYTARLTPEDLQKAEEFRKVLKQVDAMLGTPQERARKKAEEKKVQEAKEEKQKRIEELYAKLAKLRAQLAAKGGQDPGLEAEIAGVQAELNWLLFGF